MAARRIVINDEYDALEGAYRASSKAHVDCLLKRKEGCGNCGRGISACGIFPFPSISGNDPARSLAVSTRCLM